MKYLLCFLFLQNAGFAQSAEKTNPIIFGNLLLGATGGDAAGVAVGLDLNYQLKKNLISARITGRAVGIRSPLAFVFIPLFFDPEYGATEYALLYGRRYITRGHAFSFSGGISYNSQQVFGSYPDYNDELKEYAGFPFEPTVQFFNREKKRYRILGIIPVGEPIAYGSGIGLKLFGSVSRTSHIGLGIIFGAGTFKKYTE